MDQAKPEAGRLGAAGLERGAAADGDQCPSAGLPRPQAAGLMFAAVTLDTMVRHVDEVSAAIGQPVFVLQGHDWSWPRRASTPAWSGPGHPLPLLAEAGDPVLAAMWARIEAPLTSLGDRLRGEARRSTRRGRTGSSSTARSRASATSPGWSAPTCRPASPASRSSACGGRCCSASPAWCWPWLPPSGSAGAWRGRSSGWRSGPAHPAPRSGHVAPLPRSHMRELDHAARAFNAMRNGLAWFEAYVPRRLVRQLMGNPSPDAVASRQLEVTVLFTDIVGFSRLAEQLDATPGGGAAQRAFRAAGRLRRRDRRDRRQVPGRRDDGVLGRASAAGGPCRSARCARRC